MLFSKLLPIGEPKKVKIETGYRKVYLKEW